MSDGAGPTDRLEDGGAGQWLVVTESSTYLFDLDERTATRYPGTGAGAVDAWLSPVSGLRQDGDRIPLTQLTRCEIGKRLLAVLDVRRDGVITLRESTTVISISRIDPVPVDLA